jgi:hypothetical protein
VAGILGYPKFEVRIRVKKKPNFVLRSDPCSFGL